MALRSVLELPSPLIPTVWPPSLSFPPIVFYFITTTFPPVLCLKLRTGTQAQDYDSWLKLQGRCFPMAYGWLIPSGPQEKLQSIFSSFLCFLFSYCKGPSVFTLLSKPLPGPDLPQATILFKLLHSISLVLDLRNRAVWLKALTLRSK